MKEFKFSNHTEHDYSKIAALQSKPSPNRKFRVFLFTLVLAAGFGFYSSYSQIQATRCKAIVKADTRSISSTTEGSLVKVFLEVGNSFKKGDLLAEMDKSDLNSELAFLKQKVQYIKSAVNEKQRRAEETNLYNLKKWEWQQKERRKKMEAESFQLELDEKEAQQKILELQGKSAESVERIKGYKRLVFLKAATNREVKDLEKYQEAVKNRLAYWKQRRTKLKARKESLADTMKKSAPQLTTQAEGISFLKIKLSDLHKQLEEVNQKLGFCEIRAHCSGIVLELFKREGDELKENEALLTFYQKDKLWLEAYASPADISKVMVGSRVDLINAEGKLITQAGQVTRIMPRLGQLPRELINSGHDNGNYYPVKIQLNGSVLRPVYLYPGSPLDVSISRESLLRRSSVLAWL